MSAPFPSAGVDPAGGGHVELAGDCRGDEGLAALKERGELPPNRALDGAHACVFRVEPPDEGVLVGGLRHGDHRLFGIPVGVE